ncbi:M23 family metallopeptidase [Candidatus Peribacteria bacterium]|nr:M23 family metallopeptidase [Candidatus Peribacteria bacterium]
MTIVNRKRHGFSSRKIHASIEPHAVHYLSQRTSFWIAALSVIAYVAGNMMGQYGWHTFWASVLGRTDDSLIVYTGTVTPIAQVPDFERWSRYGGNPKEHTFQQVPRDVLIPLPQYNASTAGEGVYSIGHLGSYATGAENSGSHVGVDIRVPVGTPVRSIASGIVERVQLTDSGGMGIMVVIRHPNVPDPVSPQRTTTLHSVYGHLSSAIASEGMVVSKGELIGYSGKTGFATGPHLHFQIDRDDAPWHPFWPFSYSDQHAAGLSFVAAVDHGLQQSEGRKYTVHPMLYVQANYPPARTTLASADPSHLPSLQSSSAQSRASSRDSAVRTVSRLAERRQSRIASRALRNRVAALAPEHAAASSSASNSVVVSRSTVVTASPEFPSSLSLPEAYTVEITHDGAFTGRTWESVRIRILDAMGEPVRSPDLSSDIYLRTSFGEAEFKPMQLTRFDFDNGTAMVQMLPRGRRTVIIEAKPYGVTSKPMASEDD